MDLVPFGAKLCVEPKVTKYEYEDLGDDPDNHRWRARWEYGFDFPVAPWIELCAYPVIKTNPASVWINEDGYRQSTGQPGEDGSPGLEWVPFDETCMKKRLLHNGSGSAWAKPTQEEAIRSLAIRLNRWARHVARDLNKIRAAASVLEELRPNLKYLADEARSHVDGK